MSDIRARYVGHPDGIAEMPVPLANGETRRVSIKHGAELPTEIDGVKVPASFRDSLLEQEANWTRVDRASKPAAKAAAETTPSGEEGDK